MQFNFWSVTYTVIIFYGLFLSVNLLASDSINKRAMRILSFLILVFLLVVFEELVETARLYGKFPHLYRISMPLPLLFGPLMYLYADEIIHRYKKFNPVKLLHLLPFVISVIVYMDFYLKGAEDKFNTPGISADVIIFVYIKLIHFVIYLFFTVHIINSYLEGGADIAENNRLNVKWFKHISIFIGVCTVIVYGIFTLSLTGVRLPLPFADDLGALVISISILWAGSMVLRKPFVFSRVPGYAEIETAEIIAETKKVKYRTSGLGSEEKERLSAALLKYMEEEKPYLKEDLNLKDLADMTGMSVHNLSQVINEIFEKGFSEFVNYYRVEEFKKKAADPIENKKTILALAFESGFGNKASFNRIFKQFTGKTPSAYKKSL